MSDGLEPHDTFCSAGLTRAVTVVPVTGMGVYPGWCEWVGTGRVLYRAPSRGLDLRLIYGI